MTFPFEFRTLFARLRWLPALLLIGVSLAAQEQPSLGDAARQARQQKQDGNTPKARKVLDDEGGSAPTGYKRVHHGYAGTLPSAFASLLVPEKAYPDHGSPDLFAVPLGKSNVLISFGPSQFPGTLLQTSLGDAEDEYFRTVLRGLGGAPATVLNSHSVTVSGQPARVATYKIDGTRRSMQGVAVFVTAPNQTLVVACTYPLEEYSNAASLCDAIIQSVEVTIPTNYKTYQQVYGQHY